MKRSFVILVLVVYIVNVYCVPISFYIPSNPPSFQEDTLLGSTVETHQRDVNIVATFDQGPREKRSLRKALRKRRTATYSDKIYFPGETSVITTTIKPVVPCTVKLRKKIIIKNDMCPKGTRFLGSWCVPSNGNDYDDY